MNGHDELKGRLLTAVLFNQDNTDDTWLTRQEWRNLTDLMRQAANALCDRQSAAVTMGRTGGQAKTEGKAKAARANIQKAIAARWKGHKPSPKQATAKAGKRKR
jgi:hypothetical protein